MVATLPLYGLILKWGVSVVFIANALCYTPRLRYTAHVRTYSTAMTVNELHVFLSSQPWKKKENVRSKGSESGKSCTRACTCTSHVASGVENGQFAPPFAECTTLSYFRRCASSSLGLLTGLCGVVACLFPSLLIYVLLFLLHRCELRTLCNLFYYCHQRRTHTLYCEHVTPSPAHWLSKQHLRPT